MDVFEFSAKGLRNYNQDYVHGCILDGGDTAVYVVADGMGGYEYGDVAAKTTVDAIIDYIASHHDKLAPGCLLKEAFKFANDSLYIKRLSLDVQDMGCVAVALFIKNNTAYMAWIGDSRIYFYRDGKLAFRTKDHSLVEELSKVRSLTANDIYKYSAIVTRAIMGTDQDVTPDLTKTETHPGDVFVLCTDGVHKQLDVSAVAVADAPSLKADLLKAEPTMEDNYSLIRIKV